MDIWQCALGLCVARRAVRSALMASEADTTFGALFGRQPGFASTGRCCVFAMFSAHIALRELCTLRHVR